jgi:hypothetical protein
MKELTVKVTDKSDDTTLKPSSVSGKVCDKYILGSSTQGIILQKKNESQDITSGSLPADELTKKRVAFREALKAHWRCEIHSIGDKTMPCWQDGITNHCYALAENNLNMWANILVH